MAFQVDPLAQPGTVTLYLGANRGRGQAYPNGDISNVVVSRSEAVGLCPGWLSSVDGCLDDIAP